MAVSHGTWQCLGECSSQAALTHPSFHTNTMPAFLLPVMKTLAQRLCHSEGGHVFLFFVLPPRALTQQLLSPEQWLGWDGRELAKIILAQY